MGIRGKEGAKGKEACGEGAQEKKRADGKGAQRKGIRVRVHRAGQSYYTKLNVLDTVVGMERLRLPIPLGQLVTFSLLPLSRRTVV